MPTISENIKTLFERLTQLEIKFAALETRSEDCMEIQKERNNIINDRLGRFEKLVIATFIVVVATLGTLIGVFFKM